MTRLFIAIRPPPPIRALLLGAMGGVAGARWQRDDQLHLTLRFIGEVDRHGRDDLDAALAAIRHPAFDIAVQGLGTFDHRGRIDTLWAGVAPHAPLRILHNKVDQAVLRAGIPPDRRQFAPHITLARLNRSSGPVDAMLRMRGDLSSPVFRVDQFRLYESVLTPDGAHYAPLALYSLD